MTAEDGPDILQQVLARFAPGWPAWVDCNEGWWSIIAQLDRDIADIAPDYVVHQIKEKFGGLRYYYGVTDGGWDERIETLIRASEKEADHTCAACGEPGRARRGSWIKTLCDAHAKPASTA